MEEQGQGTGGKLCQHLGTSLKIQEVGSEVDKCGVIVFTLYY